MARRGAGKASFAVVVRSAQPVSGMSRAKRSVLRNIQVDYHLFQGSGSSQVSARLPDKSRKFGMVDEGISVSLELFENELVASFFEGVRRVGQVPLEESVEVTHFGAIEVAGDEGEIGGLAVGTIVAHGHVKEGTRNIADDIGGRLKGVGIHGPELGKTGRRGDVEEKGGAVGVDFIIRGKEVVEVAIVGAALVGVAT